MKQAVDRVCFIKFKDIYLCFVITLYKEARLLSNVRDYYFTKVSYVNLAPNLKPEIKLSELLVVENST